MAHKRLDNFFIDFQTPDRQINLTFLGDSMTGDDTGNFGQAPSATKVTWDWKQRSDGQPGVIGQGALCPASSSFLVAQLSGGTFNAVGGVWSRQVAETLTGVGLQPCARNLWAAGPSPGPAARTAGTNIVYAAFCRDRQQVGSTGNNIGRSVLGNEHANQYSRAKLIWRGAGAQALDNGACQITAARRADSAAYNNTGATVGAPIALNMSGSSVGSQEVVCGNGAGEPGYILETLGQNTKANETMYLLGHSFYRRADAAGNPYAGVFLLSIGSGGWTTQNAAKALGCTTFRDKNGSADAITPYIPAADAQAIIQAHTPSNGATTGPTHWIIRLTQNEDNTSLPTANHHEANASGAGVIGAVYYHVLDIIERCRAISFNLNGVYPKILLHTPINVKEAGTVLNRQTRADAILAAADVYGNSVYDAWADTYPALAYGNTVYPPYVRGAAFSDSVDGIHESYEGAIFNARRVWEAGMRSLGLDPGLALPGATRALMGSKKTIFLG